MADTVKFTTEEPYKNVEIVVSPKRVIPPHASRWAGLENAPGVKVKFVNGEYETDDEDIIALLETKPYVTKVEEGDTGDNGDNGDTGDNGDNGDTGDNE